MTWQYQWYCHSELILWHNWLDDTRPKTLLSSWIVLRCDIETTWVFFNHSFEMRHKTKQSACLVVSAEWHTSGVHYHVTDQVYPAALTSWPTTPVPQATSSTWGTGVRHTHHHRAGQTELWLIYSFHVSLCWKIWTILYHFWPFQNDLGPLRTFSMIHFSLSIIRWLLKFLKVDSIHLSSRSLSAVIYLKV